MITIKGEGLQDGLYNIKNGKIFKYKAGGGTVRTYEMGEVVTCKDCKNSEHWYRDRRRCFLWSEDGVSVFDDGFCSYAERRTDG